MLPFLLIFALTFGCFAIPPPSPSPPTSVVEGGRAILHLYQSAFSGVFLPVLPPELRYPIQPAWEMFLKTEGKGIVDDFYTKNFEDYENLAKYHGKHKFLRTVTYQGTGSYVFNPNRSPLRQEFSLLLVEKFAEEIRKHKVVEEEERARKVLDEKKGWGSGLTLGRGGGEGSSSRGR